MKTRQSLACCLIGLTTRSAWTSRENELSMSDAASVRAERSWQDHKVPHALYTDESIYHQELDRIFHGPFGHSRHRP